MLWTLLSLRKTNDFLVARFCYQIGNVGEELSESVLESCGPWLAWPQTSYNMVGFARVFFWVLSFFKAETLKLKILRRNRKRNLMQTNTTDLYTALISYVSIVPFIMKKPSKIYKLPSKGNILSSVPQCAHHWKPGFRADDLYLNVHTWTTMHINWVIISIYRGKTLFSRIYNARENGRAIDDILMSLFILTEETLWSISNSWVQQLLLLEDGSASVFVAPVSRCQLCQPIFSTGASVSPLSMHWYPTRLLHRKFYRHISPLQVWPLLFQVSSWKSWP